MTVAEELNWVAVDWGTTHLRCWAMGADDQILATTTSRDGMGGLSPDCFEPALLGQISPWLPAGRTTPVICCGMVGARQGWVEAKYQSTPCTLLGLSGTTLAPAIDTRLAVHVLPGVRQDHPADVMRGEETQIAGLLAQNANFDGIVCLPGTHTKWVHVRAGEIISFATYMTGELFGLLSEKSVLRHTVSGNGWDNAAFDFAISESMAAPSTVANRLFSLRAKALISVARPANARASLSGLLIGLELDASRSIWTGREVHFIGARKLIQIYERALHSKGVATRKVDGEAMTLAGLKLAHATLLTAEVGRA